MTSRFGQSVSGLPAVVAGFLSLTSWNLLLAG
jgi:hypothetical protein